LLQSTDIALSYRGRNNRYLVQAGVKVEDAQGTAVAGATVDITWTLPGDKIDQQSVVTGINGIAVFTTRGHGGTYTLTVNDIALTDYTFDPANSVLQDSIPTNTTREEDTP
jgi:hypothetical protein